MTKKLTRITLVRMQGKWLLKARWPGIDECTIRAKDFKQLSSKDGLLQTILDRVGNPVCQRQCEKSKRWIWMMEYCKRHELNPAQKWAWDRAGRAYKQAKA